MSSLGVTNTHADYLARTAEVPHISDRIAAARPTAVPGNELPRLGRNWWPEKSCGKALRPFRSAVFERASRSSTPVVFDGDQCNDPAARSPVQECIARMRTADCGDMGGRIWIGIGGAAHRARIDNQRSGSGMHHAR